MDGDALVYVMWMGVDVYMYTGPPVFLLVVDTCLDDAELENLKDSLQQVTYPTHLST